MICEADPWRLQYFQHVHCPESVRIPTEDCDAWTWYPEHRWVYNKLAVAESQGLACGPHGLAPASYPVFSKPVFNLRGMGAGSRILRSPRDYKLHEQAGHMWEPFFEGDHVSSDVAVIDGDCCWWRHTLGKPLAGGTFDYWTVAAQARPDIEASCGEWLRRHLRGYTGMVNLETIGGHIIECHLRFADQWPDLYGHHWVRALVKLYAAGSWDFDDGGRHDGYSVVLFGPHGVHYRHPPATVVTDLLRRPGVSSIQITFHEDRPPEWHSMPPGGFRLAIVNCWNLEVGKEVRNELAPWFDTGSRRPHRQAV